jgi:hypothetical protein
LELAVKKNNKTWKKKENAHLVLIKDIKKNRNQLSNQMMSGGLIN